jgi:hypothetical protein
MRKVIIVTICVFAVLSCMKDATQSHDVYANYTYQVYLDDSNRVVKYLKTLDNGAILEKHLFVFDTISVTHTLLDQYNVLLEKVVYYMNDKGYAIRSVDTVYFGNEIKIFIKKYIYESDFLVEIDGIEKDYDHDILGDTVVYSMNNYIANGNVIKAVRTADTTCTINYTYYDLGASIDVIGWTNTLFGKTNKNLVESITYFPDCPCSQSSKPALSVYEYEIDANKHIIKSVETYTPCGSKQDYREVTTSIYQYSSI